MCRVGSYPLGISFDIQIFQTWKPFCPLILDKGHSLVCPQRLLWFLVSGKAVVLHVFIDGVPDHSCSFPLRGRAGSVSGGRQEGEAVPGTVTPSCPA